MQFDPIGGALFTSSCDVAKTALASARVPYSNEAAPVGTVALVKVGGKTLHAFDGSTLSTAEFGARHAAFKQEVCVMTVIVGTFFLKETRGNEAV